MAFKLSVFLAELRRRKVIRVAVAYVVVGFGVASGAQYIFEMLGFPVAAAQFVAILMILGFPVALVLAWAYEIRPDASRVESLDLDTAPGARQPSGDEEPKAQARSAVSPDVAPDPSGTTPSVGVLPFESMSPGSEDDYFADGISEELTNALAKQAGLRVAARFGHFRAPIAAPGHRGVRDLHQYR
jgi:hypothetical protein